MQESYITSTLNLFTLEQDVYKVTPESFDIVSCATLENLPFALANMCHTYDIYKVKLSGPDELVNECVEKIAQEEARFYSTNKIEVEVVK